MTKTKKKIKLISWNVNGLRAVIKKDFFDSFRQLDADIFALQEIKLQGPQLTDEMKRIQGYESHWSHATVKKVLFDHCPQTVDVPGNQLYFLFFLSHKANPSTKIWV